MKALSQDQLRQLTARAGSSPEVSPLPGATSSDLFLLSYPAHREVLRVFRTERWDDSAKDLSAREVRILEALQVTTLPTPKPLGTFGDNGVLMSWLPGAVILPKRPDAAWLASLARTLNDIHRSRLNVPYTYEAWNDTTVDDRPDWWQDGSLWADAQALSAEAPDFDPILIHRDYHPVNVLWEGESISGIVDWINACLGPAGIDVAHCRLNLAIMYGQETAEAFLAAYRHAAPGYRHDCFWDLEDALGALPSVKPYAPWAEFGLTGLTTKRVRTRLETFIKSAVQSL